MGTFQNGFLGGWGFPFDGSFGKDISLIVIVFVAVLLFFIFSSIGLF